MLEMKTTALKNKPRVIVVSRDIIQFLLISRLIYIYVGFPVGINMSCNDFCYDRLEEFIF
jgi:hypothetical protein